jgi:hypothetical protein
VSLKDLSSDKSGFDVDTWHNIRLDPPLDKADFDAHTCHLRTRFPLEV